MLIKRKYRILIPLGFLFLFSACTVDKQNENTDTVKPAKVTFWNTSAFRVHIYKNLNPEHFDPTTLVLTLNSGEDKTISLYPSYDQVMGDAFYPRYQKREKDILWTGTKDLYIPAERVLSNMTFVIESGKAYTRTIPQPTWAEIRFLHGYIEITNLGNSQIQLILGTSILSSYDEDSVYINSNGKGFYEIQFPYYGNDGITISQLKAQSDITALFPSFTMERGKRYVFTVNGVNITGPVVFDLRDGLGLK